MTNYEICESCKCEIDITTEKMYELHNGFINQTFMVCLDCYNNEDSE